MSDREEVPFDDDDLEQLAAVDDLRLEPNGDGGHHEPAQLSGPDRRTVLDPRSNEAAAAAEAVRDIVAARVAGDDELLAMAITEALYVPGPDLDRVPRDPIVAVHVQDALDLADEIHSRAAYLLACNTMLTQMAIIQLAIHRGCSHEEAARSVIDDAAALGWTC